MSIKRGRTFSSEPKNDSMSKDEGPTGNPIEVIVRMRPLLETLEDEVVWDVDEENKAIRSRTENINFSTLNVSNPKFLNEFANSQKFIYDNVEGMESRTKDIFNKKLKKIVDSVLEGYNGTIFLYGQTTSGKTFTMLGTQKEPGILPYSLRTIFVGIPKMKNFTFQVSVSYLEIYNENINDLLVPGSSNLKILDDPKFGVIVKGLKRQEVSSFEDAIFLMSYGEEHRKYRETNMNEHSSRSHSIYQVFIESFEETETEGRKRRHACLNLVDLAGSERLADNGGNTDGQTGETGHINKSLFLLTNVIKKLADGKTRSHIPYRDSKLTRILSNAIGGNSLTTVICTISPALTNYAQTLSTLRFASRAKKVKNGATENVEEGPVIDGKLKEEVKFLREKLSESEHHSNKMNTLNMQLEDSLHATKLQVKSLQKEMEELKNVFLRETSVQRHTLEENMSNTSLLEIMNDEMSATIKTRSRMKIPQNNAQSTQPNMEIFFGDPILTLVEQMISENNSILTNMSIDNSATDNSNTMKDWSTLCLKAKQNYLKELKSIQGNFVTALDEASAKFVNMEQNPEIATQIKTYVNTEFQKIDGLQSRIAEYIKKVDPHSLVNLDKSASPGKKSDGTISTEQPNQNEKSADSINNDAKQAVSTAEAVNSRYTEILSNLEKKYDEIYSLVSQALVKKDDSVNYENSSNLNDSINDDSMYHDINAPNDSVLKGHGDQKKYHFDSSFQSNQSTDSLNSVGDNSVILKGDNNIRRKSRAEQRIIAIGKSAPQSAFARLKTERERKSVSYIQDDSYGNMYLWGSGKDGRLGNGKYANEAGPNLIRDVRFAKIACGYHNSFGISQEGLVYGWGRNENGQLGNGSYINTPIPINVTGFNRITVIDIVCGWQHCLALSNEGRLFSWGCGDEGQLGHGDNCDLISPSEVRFFERTQVVKIAAGHSQSAAITTENLLYTWGHNSDYRLMNSNAQSHFIPTLTEVYKRAQSHKDERMDIISISMGATHICLVTENGNVYTAGRGHEGQLGKQLTKGMECVELFRSEEEIEEQTEEILCSYFTKVEAFGAQNRAVSASCGEKYTLVLTENGKVYSFGDATDGCLGLTLDEKEKKIYEPTLVEGFGDVVISVIVAGPRHAACVSDSGEMYCWGFNYYDQTEVGKTKKDYHIPTKVDKLVKQHVVSVSCGYFHSAALVDN